MEVNNENELLSNDSDEDFTARKKHGKQALRIESDDSDNENFGPITNTVDTSNVIVDGNKSDDNQSDRIESENSSNESKESSDDEKRISSSVQRKKKRRKKKSGDQEVNNELKSKISALCDVETSSSSDEGEDEKQQVEAMQATKIQRAPQRMSAKQAEEQMKIIQSESQRLARECPLSVPYHKPKQHSLKDFLNRRTINRPVPMALTKKAAATIKMSKEELEQYAKSLEDRNKESQEFYRSDTDGSKSDEKEMETNPKDDELQNVQSEVETTAVAVNDVDESTGPICALPEITETEPEKSSEANDVVVVESVDMIHDSMADVRDVESEIVNKRTGDTPNESVPTSSLNDSESQTANRITKETIEIDYDFGENEKRNDIKTLKDLRPLYGSVKPCLRGSPNDIINLNMDDDKPTKSGSDKLLERFIKHVALKPNRSAKEVSILSTDNGVIELNNVKLETDDHTCIHSKPRKDVFRLKQELSARIAARRKEELLKKQMAQVEIPMENSDSEDDDLSKGKTIEDSCDVNGDNDKENYESDVEEIGSGNEGEENMDEELNDGNENVVEEDVEEEEEDDDDVISELDGPELVQKSKQRKRIILMDNSDEDENELSLDEGNQAHSADTEELNTTSISLDESLIVPDPIDKTMSQICANQNRADRLIDSCSRIVPEETESDNNMSTLFTETADNLSVSELLDLCSGSFVTQATDAHFVEHNAELGFETQTNTLDENGFSDDEIGLPKKSKQRKKVNISDDEEQDDQDANVVHNDESNTSNNDIHERNESDGDDDSLSDEEGAVERIVEYDSEENEIEVPVVQKKKISEFFENEAELSESEWGSADEDERNLDKFEIELGDEDEFDQNQLVSELDRIHRRRMLDQDAREVKIIKDTHFEDEEESGVGRQRQFKWKHMENALTMDEHRKADEIDGDENAKSDDENEETWRRMRYERNNILQEAKNQNDSIGECKLTATTKTKKRISIVKTSANLNTSATKDLSFLINRMKEEHTHRSSLLIRDEKTLANLAKMTTDDTLPSVNTNSKHFLFNVISSDEGKPQGKRKLDDDGTESENKNQKTVKKIKKSTLSVLDKLMM